MRIKQISVTYYYLIRNDGCKLSACRSFYCQYGIVREALAQIFTSYVIVSDPKTMISNTIIWFWIRHLCIRAFRFLARNKTNCEKLTKVVNALTSGFLFHLWYSWDSVPCTFSIYQFPFLVSAIQQCHPWVCLFDSDSQHGWNLNEELPCNHIVYEINLHLVSWNSA